MNSKEQPRACSRWRRFCHKNYAVFRSLHTEVSIGVLGVAMLSSCAFVNNTASCGQEQLQQGDLLFCLEPDESDGLGGAIAAVTGGVGSQRITHVAIAVDSVRIVEATPREGVRVINLWDFIQSAGTDPDGEPLLLLGRLRDTTGVAASVERALTYVGRPYDVLYQPDDSAIYCSELVQLSYRRADGTSIFPQQPMTFRDSTGQIPSYWTELYAGHGMAVPEGEPGTNPVGLSQSEELDLLKAPYIIIN